MPGATIRAGNRARDLLVDLDMGDVFVWTIRRRDGLDWPDGTEWRYQFESSDGVTAPIVWPADLDGPLAVWNINNTQVRAVLQARALEVKIYFNNRLWAKGHVNDNT